MGYNHYYWDFIMNVLIINIGLIMINFLFSIIIAIWLMIIIIYTTQSQAKWNPDVPG
jgi:hypothetical protein